MNNKNIKVVDEHAIDREAKILFGLELEGSDYVAYWISRDEDSNNVFVSKVVKNIDETFNLLDIEDSDEKARVSEIIKVLISKSVSDENDKVNSETLTLSDGKVVKFISVLFNKEQRFNVQKAYITTVKKEVTNVTEKYYDIVLSVPVENKVEEVVPTVVPVQVEKENVVPAEVAPVVEAAPQPVVAPAPVVTSTPVVEAAPTVVATPVVPVAPQPAVAPAPVVTSTPVVEAAPTVVATPVVPVAPQPAAAPAPAVTSTPVVEAAPTVVATPVVPVAPQPVVVPAPVQTTATTPVNENPGLVFNAVKETNLNAALGEVANSAALPVQNIEPVREFGVETPVVQPTLVQPAIAPIVQPEVVADTVVAGKSKVLTRKAGFANNKFFMVVAIAFFLASCIFLGYEVFNYFQLTK